MTRLLLNGGKRIVYRTVDITGRPTTASELVAMPKNDERDLRVVSWLHGTCPLKLQ
ncbi:MULTISPECIES: hypothetical protein [unclassified Streptomyces]|uniref:hypothetical protein n=1 Tax=unclassified Streptomyces TaxID=2593676 RepID=UPI0033DCECB0